MSTCSLFTDGLCVLGPYLFHIFVQHIQVNSYKYIDLLHQCTFLHLGMAYLHNRRCLNKQKTLLVTIEKWN